MAHELDDIRAQTSCPVCGGDLNVSYKTMRLGRAVECPVCGETICPIDDTPIGKIQKLIDKA
jgi:C4-type Zn-finger protein